MWVLCEEHPISGGMKNRNKGSTSKFVAVVLGRGWGGFQDGGPGGNEKWLDIF